MKNIIVYILSDSFLAKRMKVQKFNRKLKTIELDKLKEMLQDINDAKLLNNRITDEKLQVYLEHFQNVLEKNFDSEDLKNFRNNIGWLRVKVKKLPSFTLFFTTQNLGKYVVKHNTIILGKHYSLASLYHELFHLASTKLNIGFHYIIGKYSIGEALNEGYTEYLTQKYFGIEDDEKIYNTEKVVAESVEKIVGSKKMQSLYLNSNLLGLIDELQQYYSEKEIEKFLVSSDAILNYSSKRLLTKSELDKISKLYTDNIYFLLKGFCQKLSKDDNKNIKEEIINFIRALVVASDNERLYVDYDIDILNSIIVKYLGDNYIINQEEIEKEKHCRK